MRIAAKRGHKRAVVAVARKLAVLIGCGWTAASSGFLAPMAMRVATESERRRRSPPRVEALASAVSQTG
jgi:hypothetical protein